MTKTKHPRRKTGYDSSYLQSAYIRHFGGKKYMSPIKHPWLFNKKEAQEWAAHLRGHWGDKARVVKEGNKYRVFRRSHRARS